MSTVILISSMLIASTMWNVEKITPKFAKLFFFVFIVAILMDVVDFIRKSSKWK